MNYEIGDKVRIESREFFEKSFRKNSRAYLSPNKFSIIEEMLIYCNRESVIIDKYIHNGYWTYVLKLDTEWWWDEHCFVDNTKKRKLFDFSELKLVYETSI